MPSFYDLWEAYQRKDNKLMAERAWVKLKPAEQCLAFQRAPAFVRAHPDKRYRPMLSTYLNQKRFLDEELIPDEPTTTRQQQYAEAINRVGQKG